MAEAKSFLLEESSDRVSTALHQMHNALSGILASAEVLLEDSALLAPDHIRLVKAIESSSQQGFRVIEDLRKILGLKF